MRLSPTPEYVRIEQSRHRCAETFQMFVDASARLAHGGGVRSCQCLRVSVQHRGQFASLWVLLRVNVLASEDAPVYPSDTEGHASPCCSPRRRLIARACLADSAPP